jgi:hypothetical protein
MEKTSPFEHNDPVIPPIFAGRDNELSIINKTLFEEGGSMALVGNDAIGKSSILRTIHSLLLNRKSAVLPIAINAFDFRTAVEDNFLGLAAHQICAAIWTKLMNRSYSELIEESLLNVRGDSSSIPEESAVKRIFRIVTSDKLAGVGKSNKEFGAKFYVEGKVSQENQLTNERKPLAPFEFLHLLDELNDIIRTYKYDSLLVVCDELNHLPRRTNTEFLRSYFDIFASRKIQFLITVVNPEDQVKDDAKLLLDAFNNPLEIKHFQNVECVQQLVFNALNLDDKPLAFEKDAFTTLFEITDGHPWWIQKICDSIYLSASNNSRTHVNSAVIEKHSIPFKAEMEIYSRQMKKGQPFRKYHIGR